MKHGYCAGWHVINSSEGRRDAMVPLYRLKHTAPKAYFMDFACGCEQFALNYMPQYYLRTEFFHDIFHGFRHLCTARFNSRRLRQYSAINTSIMEQVVLLVTLFGRVCGWHLGAKPRSHPLTLPFLPADQFSSPTSPWSLEGTDNQGMASLFDLCLDALFFCFLL